MRTMIYCKPADGNHSFYMVKDGRTYYLFSQDYRRGVQEYYSRGVTLNEAINYSRSHKDSAIQRTMSKLPMYIRYVEKEYGIEVMEQTKKKRRCSGCRMNRCA